MESRGAPRPRGLSESLRWSQHLADIVAQGFQYLVGANGMNNRFDRNIRLFGAEGQARLARARVGIVGLGGLGSHVVQQTAYLGTEQYVLVDHETLDETNLNRYVTAKADQARSQATKTSLADSMIKSINPLASSIAVHAPLASHGAFSNLKTCDVVFGCLDDDGARFILNEFCLAYSKHYFDLATEISIEGTLSYGGRVCFVGDGPGCLSCLHLLDEDEVRRSLMTEGDKKNAAALYGIPVDDLAGSGPSVVSINGVVASLAVTEFMLCVTGIRRPNRLLNYHGSIGRVSAPNEAPAADCYYCGSVRGLGDRANLARYVK